MNQSEMYKLLYDNYICKNIKIFPVVNNSKTPLIESWQKDCSSSALQILYWLENGNQCNWGLPCTPNDLFVIDIDVHNVNGLENFTKLMNDLGLDKIETLCQKTPSGGIHLIYRSDDELRTVANTANSFKDYPGIDIRTDGYIVCYPSTINDKQYTFTGKYDVQPMPDKLKEFILSQKNIIKTEKKEKTEYIKPEVVDEGGRDTALFEYINNLYYKNNLTQDEIEVLANDFNQKVCNPPLPLRTVRYKVKKAFRKDKGKCIILWLNKEEYYEEESGEEDV